MEVTAESWTWRTPRNAEWRRRSLRNSSSVKGGSPGAREISSKPRMASHLVARAQDGNAHLPGEEEKSPVNFPQVVQPPFFPLSLSLPTLLSLNLSSSPKLNTVG